ncbi:MULTISPECIES: hypothetical protein [Actinoalloteichus]|uniref:DUF1707 domain-containing protein n=1 Tax=Actinoalloteichus caeruleus DSM 43889 TaxID=1120930 RepID=A0ABT1JGY0_ACTCY|nr:hypothetical protein [Actinoalloteichus caeruleus]MCP2331722.1 hypothetical protein [Actinoalloteichus caeruleus DSM 43889]
MRDTWFGAEDPDEGRDVPGNGTDRLRDELVGLDPDDPEVRAFAEHLDRMSRPGPTMTVEGSLRAVTEFTDSANRARGGRRALAVALVWLMLLFFALAAWTLLGFLLGGGA